MQLLGVYDVALVDTMAEVLNQLQMERALVFGGK
jgi:anthranilate phosphoribosyltransferase